MAVPSASGGAVRLATAAASMNAGLRRAVHRGQWLALTLAGCAQHWWQLSMVTQIRDQPLTGAASRLRSSRELGDPLSKHEIGGPAFDAGLRRSSIAGAGVTRWALTGAAVAQLAQIGATLLAAAAVSAGPAHAQTKAASTVDSRETTAPLQVELSSFAVVDFLTGGAVTASRPGTGTADKPISEPPWLGHWQQTLQRTAQPSRAASELTHHPLGRVTPTLLDIPLQPTVAPVVAVTMTWPELTCPTLPAAKRPPQLAVSVQTLFENEIGWPTLGVQLSCHTGSHVVRSVRLVVAADTRGMVQRAFGVRLEAALPLPGEPSNRQAQPAWPIGPAHLASQRPAWMVPNGHGWLAQIAQETVGAWREDGMAVQAESFAAAEPAPPKRGMWWFDRVGQPVAVLLAHGAPLGRQTLAPLVKEAFAEFAPTERGELFVLQRIAALNAVHQPVHAGYCAWRLDAGRAELWRVGVPALALEGTWNCQPISQDLTLHCHFAAAGTAVQFQVSDITLVTDRTRRQFGLQSSK
ncbi:MAG: hypothetical protein EXR77_11215 [Myxococcales bacterium]|nr:hypothetical protein [Myxococcales bacterium]